MTLLDASKKTIWLVLFFTTSVFLSTNLYSDPRCAQTWAIVTPHVSAKLVENTAKKLQKVGPQKLLYNPDSQKFLLVQGINVSGSEDIPGRGDLDGAVRFFAGKSTQVRPILSPSFQTRTTNTLRLQRLKWVLDSLPHIWSKSAIALLFFGIDNPLYPNFPTTWVSPEGQAMLSMAEWWFGFNLVRRATDLVPTQSWIEANSPKNSSETLAYRSPENLPLVKEAIGDSFVDHDFVVLVVREADLQGVGMGKVASGFSEHSLTDVSRIIESRDSWFEENFRFGVDTKNLDPAADHDAVDLPREYFDVIVNASENIGIERVGSQESLTEEFRDFFGLKFTFNTAEMKIKQNHGSIFRIFRADFDRTLLGYLWMQPGRDKPFAVRVIPSLRSDEDCHALEAQLRRILTPQH